MCSIFKQPMHSYLLYEMAPNFYVLNHEFGVKSHHSIYKEFCNFYKLFNHCVKVGFSIINLIPRGAEKHEVKFRNSNSDISENLNIFYFREECFGESSLYFIVTYSEIEDFENLKCTPSL